MLRGVGSVRSEQTVITTIPNLALWLRANDISGFSSGTGVSLWRDRSGNNNDSSNSTSGERPLYQTNVQNGLPALQFTSASSQHLVGTTNLGSSKDSRTFFAVFQHESANDGSNAAGIIGQTSGGNAGAWFAMQSRAVTGSSGTPYFAGYGADVGGSTFTTAWTVGTITYSSASSVATVRRSGSERGTGLVAINTPVAPYRVGINSSDTSTLMERFNGFIGEVVCYTTILSSAQLEAVERELGAKWGITITT